MPIAVLNFTTQGEAKNVVILFLGITFATLLTVYGALLIFQPELFLKLYDKLNPGDYWGRNANWRKDVHNSEFKLLGAVLLASGVLFLGLLSKILLGMTNAR